MRSEISDDISNLEPSLFRLDAVWEKCYHRVSECSIYVDIIKQRMQNCLEARKSSVILSN